MLDDAYVKIVVEYLAVISPDGVSKIRESLVERLIVAQELVEHLKKSLEAFEIVAPVALLAEEETPQAPVEIKDKAKAIKIPKPPKPPKALKNKKPREAIINMAQRLVADHGSTTAVDIVKSLKKRFPMKQKAYWHLNVQRILRDCVITGKHLPGIHTTLSPTGTYKITKETK